MTRFASSKSWFAFTGGVLWTLAGCSASEPGSPPAEWTDVTDQAVAGSSQLPRAVTVLSCDDDKSSARVRVAEPVPPFEGRIRTELGHFYEIRTFATEQEAKSYACPAVPAADIQKDKDGVAAALHQMTISHLLSNIACEPDSCIPVVADRKTEIQTDVAGGVPSKDVVPEKNETGAITGYSARCMSAAIGWVKTASGVAWCVSIDDGSAASTGASSSASSSGASSSGGGAEGQGL